MNTGDENKAKKDSNQCFIHGICGLFPNSETEGIIRN